MSSPSCVHGVYAASGENPWIQILSADPQRPWRRNLKATDMCYYSLNKRRLLDRSDPRYAVQYMRLKLHSRQPRRTSLSVSDSAQSSLYVADEQDIGWSRDPKHRWSRKRYSGFWPHEHSLRLEHHVNKLRFDDSNRMDTYGQLDRKAADGNGHHGLPPEDWSPTDSVFDGSGWKRRSITRGGEYRSAPPAGKLECLETGGGQTKDYETAEGKFRNTLEDARYLVFTSIY